MELVREALEKQQEKSLFMVYYKGFVFCKKHDKATNAPMTR
jgi:hypothetical protein